MNITELLRKRILAKEGNRSYNVAVTELKILEISPSGTWVKLMNMNGNKYWRAVQEIALVEVLKDLDVKPPPV